MGRGWGEAAAVEEVTLHTVTLGNLLLRLFQSGGERKHPELLPSLPHNSPSQLAAWYTGRTEEKLFIVSQRLCLYKVTHFMKKRISGPKDIEKYKKE